MGGMEDSFTHTHIHILGINWRQVATFMLQLLHVQGNALVSIEYRAESWFGCFETGKSVWPLPGGEVYCLSCPTP